MDSYLKWKHRRLLIAIMHGWRHHALYGRIDAMYSRQMLMKSLQEQKIVSNTLENMSQMQCVEIEKLGLLLKEETMRTDALEQTVQDAARELQAQKQLTKQAESHINRLQAIIDVSCPG